MKDVFEHISSLRNVIKVMSLNVIKESYQLPTCNGTKWSFGMATSCQAYNVQVHFIFI